MGAPTRMADPVGKIHSPFCHRREAPAVLQEDRDGDEPDAEVGEGQAEGREVGEPERAEAELAELEQRLRGAPLQRDLGPPEHTTRPTPTANATGTIETGIEVGHTSIPATVRASVGRQKP